MKKVLALFAKFGLVGGVNTILSLVIYYIVLSINSDWYVFGIVLGYIISSVVGYFLNKLFVFRRADLKHAKSLPRYYLVYISALVLNVLLMKLWVDKLNFSSLVAPILTLCFTIPYNFILSKLYVFSDDWESEKKKAYTWLSKNWGFALFTVVFLIISLFVLGMNHYSHPAADDYYNVNRFYSALGDDDLNLLTGTGTVFKMAARTYEKWQGTYFSNVLFFINPLLGSVGTYRVAMAMIQILYFVSVFYLIFSIKKVTRNTVSTKQAMIVSMGLVIFSLAFMMLPSEGIYWFTGAVMYLVPFAMSLFLLGLLMRFYQRRKLSTYIALLLLVIALGGTSYVTGLFVGMVLLLLSIRAFIRKHSTRYYSLALLIVFCIGFAFNVFCPGNFMRVAQINDCCSESRSIVRALLMSAPLAFEMIKYTLFGTVLIPATILLVPLMIRIIKNTKYDYKFRFALPIILLAAFIAFYVPCAYSYNSFYEEARVKNVQFWYLTMMIEFAVFYVLGAFYQKHKQVFAEKNSRFYYIIGASLLVATLAGIGVDSLKTTTIIEEFTFGDARDYNYCMNNLYLQIEDADSTAEIRNCEVMPSSLHTMYFSNDSGDWIRKAVEKYYHKSIVIKED